MKHFYLAVGLAAFALVSCAGAKTSETGPKLGGQVECNLTTIRTNDPSQAPPYSKPCTLDDDPKVNGYKITLSVDATSGDKHDEGMETKATKFPPKAFSVQIAVDGSPLPAPTFKQGSEFLDGSENEADPFIIPGTSKGKTLTVHIDTSDSRGLKSNVLDFKVPLN